MRNRLIVLLATGGGVGYFPGAPGLAGSVVGLGYWWLLQRWLTSAGYLIGCAVGLGVAVWCSGAAARVLGQKDPGCVVIDEIVVIPLAMLGLGAAWWEVLVAFGCFRIFDVWKPGVVNGLQHLPAGWGIVADDVVAALYACLAGHAARWLMQSAMR